MPEQARCIQNIGPREWRRRLVMGAGTLAAGVALALALMVTGVDRWWRVGLFVPFWVGALGVFQARAHT